MLSQLQPLIKKIVSTYKTFDYLLARGLGLYCGRYLGGYGQALLGVEAELSEILWWFPSSALSATDLHLFALFAGLSLDGIPPGFEWGDLSFPSSSELLSLAAFFLLLGESQGGVRQSWTCISCEKNAPGDHWLLGVVSLAALGGSSEVLAALLFWFSSCGFWTYRRKKIKK